MWLRATSSLTDLKRVREARDALADLFDNEDYGISVGALIGSVGDANREVLRVARTRLDVVAAFTWQLRAAAFDWSLVNLYLYVDASPRWRGRNMHS